MKKYIIAFAALAMVLGCAKENPFQEEPINEETEGTVVSFTADIPELTRASVNTTAFAWELGDQIAIPANGITGGYAIFTNSEGQLNTFTYTLKEGESLKAGTAYYPASVATNTYSTSFASPEAAKKAFKMEAEYALGASSLSFTHKNAIVSLSFTNVPTFASSVVVKAGGSQVATVALSSPSATVKVDVPLEPSASNTKYSFALMQGNNTLREVSKTTTLIAGTYYSNTTGIAISVINVGVVGFIYNGWASHNIGWKLRYGGGADGIQDVDLVDLSTTKAQGVGSSYWEDEPQTFYMLYTKVPSDITWYKVWWTDCSNADWFGDNGSLSNNHVYVFEYGGNKKAVYMHFDQ